MTTFADVVATLQPPNSVSHRMRAIFGLKALGSVEAVQALEGSLQTDPSILVRHEVAYVLGQMQARKAIPTLITVLRDENEDVMVRHESAEALGAIGDPTVLSELDGHANNSSLAREVRETCIVAAMRLRASQEIGVGNFGSVDPAPPTLGKTRDVNSLRAVLCNSEESIFKRYGALFALRDIGGSEAVCALCAGMESESVSALFRHEVAFVLGQMANPEAVKSLSRVLQRSGESDMVRHEAAEALGAMGTAEADAILKRYAKDSVDVVRESVEVALDISEHVASDEMHYAVTMDTRKDVEEKV